jgi:hypothetical protein
MALDEYFFPGSADYMNVEAGNPLRSYIPFEGSLSNLPFVSVASPQVGSSNSSFDSRQILQGLSEPYNAGAYNNSQDVYNPAYNIPTNDSYNPGAGVSSNASWDVYDPSVYNSSQDIYNPAAGAVSSNNAGSWLENLYNSTVGPGTALGGRSGAFTGGGSGGMGAGGQGWLPALMSIGSGIYGMNEARKQRELAQQAISGSAPWNTAQGAPAGSGAQVAGTALTNVIQGDFTNDPGYKAALQAAARTSSQQPGGFAAMAAAQAALKYQNDRIQALGPAAGVGFSPGAGYQTALGGMTSANDLASRSLGSIGYGVTGTQPMPPWLQKYLIDNNMGGR